MTGWEDATEYDLRPKGSDAPPNKWRLRVGNLSVRVSRTHDAENWSLTCAPWFAGLALSTGDLERAQELAVGLVDNEVRKLMNEWGKFWLTRNG